MGEDTFEAVALELEALTHSTFTSAKIRSLAERLRMLALLPLPSAGYGIHPVEGDPYARLALGMFRDVAPDEIDEDPPAEPATLAAIDAAVSEAFQRGYAAGQHDALDMLAGPVPNVGEQGPSEG